MSVRDTVLNLVGLVALVASVGVAIKIVSAARPPDRRVAGMGDAQAPCTTRITYSSAWIPTPNHPESFDVVLGKVDWDGACTNDGEGSYAVLSDGQHVSFRGHDACVLGFDYAPSCGVPDTCTTRVTYGPLWARPETHPAQYDDTTGRVFLVGNCEDLSKSDGGTAEAGGRSWSTGATGFSSAMLSNGWLPLFKGGGTCAFSFMYRQCSGI